MLILLNIYIYIYIGQKRFISKIPQLDIYSCIHLFNKYIKSLASVRNFISTEGTRKKVRLSCNIKDYN